MPVNSLPMPAPRLGSIVIATLVGASLAAVGLAMAYLTVATPLVASLLPPGRASSSQVTVWIWAFALIAGGALLVSGTNRLATTMARVRSHSPDRTSVAQALSALPADVAVATGVVPPDGPMIPTLAIGSFGVAILHELPRRDRVRYADGFWEARTADGWRPTEAPLDRAVRDADRVRRWLAQGNLDFVVHVYAALVDPDVAVPRTAACAVITPDQVAPWVKALPSQRSLTEPRRNRLGALVNSAIPVQGKRRGR